MNSHMIKLKQTNMLCNKCVLHVLQVLTKIEEIQELEVDLNKKLVKIVIKDKTIAKESLVTMVNNAIEGIRSQKGIGVY
ncbi:MAG: hypothetical protein APF77_21115 [Clostridia bacterium BRH_c25]|nr:MAG: hypothetical protein APF77_21115 [Clostridia bacterium BRH_c25]